MKVCSLYGAGFYYMPGTDMCIKIGGWVRSEVTWGINGSSTTGIFNNDFNDRRTNNFWTRERGYITADAREQTAYGVARGYIDVGVSSQNSGLEVPSGNFSSNRAFVQWAGFTAGLAVSFFDFYPAAAYLYRAGNLPQEDTGDGGLWVWGYTAQLGGGISATLSAEERRVTQIIGAHALVPGAAPTVAGVGVVTGTFTNGAGYGGWQSPDIVANLRADQAWGSAQIMGALHQLNPLYYGDAGLDVANGHPDDTWGFVVGGGIKINTPFISPGDNFAAEVNYTEGALKYLWNSSGVNQGVVNGGTAGYGVSADCIYNGSVAEGTASSCRKTSAWEIDAAYEHHWTPQWHQSLVGAYEAVNFDSGANNHLCALEGAGQFTFAGPGTLAAAPGCNNNWSFWGVGSRLQWDVTKSFYIGVEAIYQNLNSAKSATGLLPAAMGFTGACNTGGGGACTVSNQSNWVFTLRMHKDFLP